MLTPFDPANLPILADFATFLRYLEAKPKLTLTNTAAELKSADLWAINQRVELKAPEAWVTPRSRQDDYPLLNFLFQVATAGRLFVIQYGKTNTLVPMPNRLEAYWAMTLEEKYVFLVETAWCYAEWSVLNDDDRSGQGANWFQRGFAHLTRNSVGTPVRLLVQSWTQEEDPQTIPVFYSANAQIRAGHWLGWYDIREVTGSKRDKYALQIDQVTLTDWGSQCLPVLLQERPFRYWNKNAWNYTFFRDVDEMESDEEMDKEIIDVNRFAEVFRTLLEEPDLHSLYPINPNPQTGVFWLRVELPHHGVARTIAMPVEQTLEDLHGMIQQAFRFDNDHLYEFYLNPRNRYSGERYGDPRNGDWLECPPADEVVLAQLNLYEGQRLLYVFDFGDNWEFWIMVVRHLPDDKSTQARVTEKVGRAPKQYDY